MRAVAFAAFALTAASIQCKAQTVSPKAQRTVVERIARELVDGYVFPTTGRMVADSIASRISRGAYGSETDGATFARDLTTQLRSWTRDLHMSVLPPQKSASSAATAPPRRRLNDSVAVLADNIGYFRVGAFVGGPDIDSENILEDAMTRLRSTRALIIDLRNCPGGSADVMLGFASYFVPNGTVFGKLYARQSNSETELRSSVPRGPAYADRPVFVLTSRTTFSAAEGFTYHLKHAGRITVVGDTTGGGAHRVRGVDVGSDFVLMLPVTRVMNAKTGTDWEGVGVIPDIAVPANDALRVAKAKALEVLTKR